MMAIPSAICISTSLNGFVLEDAVDEIIKDFSCNIDEKLICFFGGDNGSGLVADADLCALMEGFTPKSGSWSDCYCPDLETAQGLVTPEWFASIMKRLVHFCENTIIIEERTETYGFQEQYDFLYRKLSVMESDY